MSRTEQERIHCARCNRSGIAVWVHADRRREIDLESLSEGFSCIGDGETHRYRCDRCRGPAEIAE